VYIGHFIAWFPIVLLAFANAAIREAVYRRYVGELTAHQIVTLTMCILVGIYVWALSRYLKPQSAGQAIGVGLMWLVMTVIFETALGRYILGNPWNQVLRDYNILRVECGLWPFSGSHSHRTYSIGSRPNGRFLLLFTRLSTTRREPYGRTLVSASTLSTIRLLNVPASSKPGE
jgi:hypothetical protein